MTYETAGLILDRLADELPEGLLEGLNGGVNLVRGEKRSDGGMYIMGEYCSGGPMGRYVNIYYGSVCRVMAGRPDEDFEKQLKRTLYHELTHHVESLAGDHSLERDDALFLADVAAERAGETMEVSSVLFVSLSDAGLCACADSLFRAGPAGDGPDSVLSGCAAADETAAGRISGAAERAARRMGGKPFERPAVLSRSLLRKFDAVFCMTEEEADGLAEDYPEFDRRIFALGDRDITPPLTALGWDRCAGEIADAVGQLTDELMGEEA